MKREDLVEKILDIKRPALKALDREKFGDGIMSTIDFDLEITDSTRKAKCSWARIIADSEVVGALLGQMRLPKSLSAETAGQALWPDQRQRAHRRIRAWLRCPSQKSACSTKFRRAEAMPMPPTDPLLYRFYEMVMVNGPRR